MRTIRVAVLMVTMFLAALAAGIVLGRSASGFARQTPKAIIGSPLAEELQLSPTQCEQIRPIWEAARDTAQDCARQAEKIQREHEEALKSMLSDEQKLQFETLSQTNHRRISEQDGKRKKAFRQAVESTTKLLLPDQRRAYEQIIKNQLGALSEPGNGGQ